jgi:hypothetical protein
MTWVNRISRTNPFEPSPKCSMGADQRSPAVCNFPVKGRIKNGDANNRYQLQQKGLNG